MHQCGLLDRQLLAIITPALHSEGQSTHNLGGESILKQALTSIAKSSLAQSETTTLNPDFTQYRYR